MAIDAKISLMKQFEQKTGKVITVEQMATVMVSLADVLEGFEIREATWAEDPGTDDMLESYIAALKVQGRSQKTIDRYHYEITRMKKAVHVPTRRITVHHLRNYLAKEQERGISDKTLEGVRQIFSSYFNWLQRECLIERNPTANLGKITVAKKKKKTYTAVEIEKLNEKVVTFEYGVRDRALINFMQSTGCRVSEVSSLNRDEVDLKNLECVVHGKGNKDRTVYFSEVTGMLLAQYLETRTDNDPCLFLSDRKKRLKPGGIRAMLKKVAAVAGVDHCHPHKFRRTLATELSRHGMPIQEVAAVLGHEKLDTTMKYVVLNDENIKHSYRRYV